MHIIALHCLYVRVSFPYIYTIYCMAFFRRIPDWCIDAYLTHQSHFSLKELINNSLQAFHNNSRCVVAHSTDPWVCVVAYDYITCMELLLHTVHSLWNIQFESQNSKLYLCSTVSVQQIRVRPI